MNIFKSFLALIVITAILLGLPLAVMAGSISGNVTDPDGNPIEDALEVGVSQDMEDWTSVEVQNGEYTIGNLQGGFYYVRAGGSEEDTWYYWVFYPSTSVEDDAEPMFIADEQDITDINFELTPGGKFTGSVVPANGGNFEMAEIRFEIVPVNNPYQPAAVEVIMSPDNFTSPVVPAGMYIIRFTPNDPNSIYAPTFFGDVWDAGEADPVNIEPAQVTDNIDVSMIVGGGISGTLMAGEGPAAFSSVIAFAGNITPYGFQPTKYAISNMDGEYTLNGLPPTGCYLMFQPSVDGYIPEWYNDAYDFLDADPIMVVAEQTVENIDIAFNLGVTISGSVRGPNDEAPENWVELELYGGPLYSDNGFEPILDDDGNWTSEDPVIPGVYALHVSWVPNEYWSTQYSNGAQFPWEAQWMYFGAGMEVGPFDIQLQEAGVVMGSVTDPDGDPVENIEVAIFRGNQRINDAYTTGNGQYRLGSLLPGEYWLMASVGWDDNGDIPGIWAATYSGDATNRSNATTFQIVAGQETQVDVQFIPGGIAHVMATKPDGGSYSFEEDNVGLVGLAIAQDGTIMWDAETNNGDGPGELGEDGTMVILPSGTYTYLALPLFTSSMGMQEAPSVRRTFVGGGFTFQGAQTFQVQAGGVTEVEIEMVETGNKVSGTITNRQGGLVPSITLAIDQSGYPVAGHGVFSAVPINAEYFIDGLPNGNYHLFSWMDNETPLVSTWYPNIGDPGETVENLTIPENAGVININNADVADANIVMQPSGQILSVPRGSEEITADDFHLIAAYPNPFNNRTTLLFNIGKTADVSWKLFDVTGREVQAVREQRYNAGTHTVVVNAENLPGGNYFIELKAGETSRIRKLTLLK